MCGVVCCYSTPKLNLLGGGLFPAFGRWGQEDPEFKVILCYTVNLRVSLSYRRPCLKTTTNKTPSQKYQE